MRDTKHIHHLLYAYNTDKFNTADEYLLKYPGDEWTDIIGFDIYQRGKGRQGGDAFTKDADRMLTTLEQIAREKNKIPALTEFGYGQVPDSLWWTGVLLKALQSHKIAYALAWRNAGSKANGSVEYYLPFKGQASEKDFIEFYKNKKTLFQKDISMLKLYAEKK